MKFTNKKWEVVMFEFAFVMFFVIILVMASIEITKDL